MVEFASPERAFWDETPDEVRYPPMQGSASADVAIIGAGMVGVTLAEILKREGKQVVLIEARRLGAQVTGRSTAKLTCLHGLVYADLMRQHGEATAAAYARANQEALEHVAQRVAELGIDCALERVAAFTHSETGNGLDAIRGEVEAAKRVGLPVEFVDDAPLPFPIRGAVRLDNQIQFHPFRYLQGLAGGVPGDGSFIFEQTRALSVDEGDPNRVITDRGVITAADVVIATNLPFPMRGLFFSRAYPRAHVVVATRIDPATMPGGMFLSTDTPSYSVRAYRDQRGAVLVATGQGFRPGSVDVSDRYDRLRSYVRGHFDVQEELCWWSNQDYDSMDRLPWVGRMAPQMRVYVATGFSAWGLSNGTAAARILADRILGRADRDGAARCFDTRRWTPRASGVRFATGNAHVARDFVRDQVEALRAPQSSELALGEGGLVRHHGRLSAVYRDDDGALHAFAARCNHMGCLLRWNRAERTWECPCHGSRFDARGRLLHGPAVHDMKRLPP